MLRLISTTRRRAVTRDYPCFAHAELLWSGCRIGTWAGIGVEGKKRRNQKEEVSGNTKPSHVSQSGYSVNPTKTRLTSYSLIWCGLTNLRFLRKPLFEWMRCVPPNVSACRPHRVILCTYRENILSRLTFFFLCRDVLGGQRVIGMLRLLLSWSIPPCFQILWDRSIRSVRKLVPGQKRVKKTLKLVSCNTPAVPVRGLRY